MSMAIWLERTGLLLERKQWVLEKYIVEFCISYLIEGNFMVLSI